MSATRFSLAKIPRHKFWFISIFCSAVLEIWAYRHCKHPQIYSVTSWFDLFEGAHHVNMPSSPKRPNQIFWYPLELVSKGMKQNYTSEYCAINNLEQIIVDQRTWQGQSMKWLNNWLIRNRLWYILNYSVHINIKLKIFSKMQSNAMCLWISHKRMLLETSWL